MSKIVFRTTPNGVEYDIDYDATDPLFRWSSELIQTIIVGDVVVPDRLWIEMHADSESVLFPYAVHLDEHVFKIIEIDNSRNIVVTERLQ